VPRSLRILFLCVDLGFVTYWLVTALHVVPAAYLFKDYANPILSAWNWSFLPLDLAVSFSGMTALLLARRGDSRAERWAVVSLALTSTSGLQAIAFWALRRDFDVLWWAPNAFLLLYPLPYLARALRGGLSAAPRDGALSRAETEA
jgi:hypothetical protein